MVSSSQVMDSQRQQYIPGPPPPPSQNQNNLGHLPPPPPRPYPGSTLPPPPPGPHPSSLPPGTVFGIPGGWQQGWARPGFGQNIPPPPPPIVNHNQPQNQHLAYNATHVRQPAQLNIPPPPPQYDKPILSATFIPGGDSFGPGVGIPPLDDYSSYSRYDNPLSSDSSRSQHEQTYPDANTAGHNYSYSNSNQGTHENVNRENRAASAASKAPLSLQMRDVLDAVSPGPPTATLINPQTNVDRGNSAASSRQRAQSAAFALASQWPLDRVLIWLAANGFSNEWQETFSTLRLEGSDFIELGRGLNGRGNLGKMHQTIYPQLQKICQNNKIGWDQAREREEGKRLRKLISRLVESSDGPISAGPGHRRRESGLITSASTDGTVENSPHPGRSDFANTPITSGPDGSPGKQMPAQFPSFSYGARTAQGRSSTLPVHSKQNSAASTPSDARHPDSFLNQGRADVTRNVLTSMNNRGRHSPNLSGDASSGLAPRTYETSPSGSPGLGYAAPTSATSISSQNHRGEHSKSNSTDSMFRTTSHSRATLNVNGSNDAARNGSSNSLNPEASTSSRFYDSRRDGQELSRPSPLDSYRNLNPEYAPGPGGKDQSKGFLSKFMRKKHDHNQYSVEEHALESPTSPGAYRQNMLFSKSSVNGSDPTSAQHPTSSTTGLDGEKPGLRLRRGTKSSRKFMFVTPDHWNYRLVDVTDVETAVALRSLICIELGVADAEYAQIFMTEPGQMDHNVPLSDNMLVAARLKSDSGGNLKFYVQSLSMANVSAPVAQPTGLGVSFSQRMQANQGVSAPPMVKSSSASGTKSDPQTVSGLNFNNQFVDSNAEELQKAAEEYRKQTEAKQRAYFESRQNRKDLEMNFSSGSIRGSGVIDFDSPRHSPFEKEKVETLIPVRRPPTAPSESSTLTKVNSLRTKNGSGTRSSLEALKRISDPIAEEGSDRARRKAGGSSPGIGLALANVGKMAGAPASLVGQSSLTHNRGLKSIDFLQKGISPGGSSRPSFTWGKGNLLFKVPDYEEGGTNQVQDNNVHGKSDNGGVQNSRRLGHSPSVSPSAEQASRPGMSSRRSYGPDLEFKETNVAFARSPRPTKDGSDDDSDDGLFAIPIGNKTTPKANKQDVGVRDLRPALTVDTDQLARKPRVAFKSPNSSGGVSLGLNIEDDGGPASGEGYDRGYSDGSFSGSALSPDERMLRRDSFVSDIWANRPAVENVVDKLDEFFPGVDLDKPFMEERGESSPLKPVEQRSGDKAPSSLRGRVTFGTEGLPLDFARDTNESDTLGSDQSTLKAKDRSTIASVTQQGTGKSVGGLSRMKSIREVAQKRNDIARGPSISVRPEVNKVETGLVRRKSTKMWGANIVQIRPKPGNRLSTLDPIPQEEVPTDETPKRQATFKIIRGQLIGKGTYGRVYLGMNATTGEFLAVKQVEVNQKIAGQDKDRIKEMVAALDQEIDTMKDLEHPNIVQYLGCERKEFSISIYLEYISGGSIGSCLRKHGKFEEPVVRSLTRQTLLGLAYLHQEGILHRDLKADNILLDLDGTCKISDFGISKKSDNIYGNDVTNSMQGSVFWMAPEVVRSQGQGYSAKVDIWSLGCVVLEMFAGKRPWSREEAIGAIFKLGKLNQAPPIPDDVQSTATVDGLAFMFDCFQINPKERPTADTLLRHSTFCVRDPYYNFYDTGLAAKLRTSDVAPLGE